MKKLVSTVLLGAFSLSAIAAAESSIVTTEHVVADAFDKLGHAVTYHTDVQNEPHLVLKSKVKGVEEMAVFFDDCNYKNQCEDVTFYSDLGKVDISDERLNGWNHIGSKMRSKAFKNDDGSVGLSMTVSFIDHKDTSGTEMLTGLFILESELFAASIDL